MTFDPSNALHFRHGFFLPNLLATGYSWAIWPLVDPGWPLHSMTFDPRNALPTLWSKMTVGHFSGNLTSGWPLTFSWIASKVYHIVGQLNASIVRKMVKLWDFALMSLMKAKATFLWYATYYSISQMAAIDLESSSCVKNWNMLRFLWKWCQSVRLVS